VCDLRLPASGLVITLVALSASPSLNAQSAGVLVRVVDDVSQRPLPNAEVIDRVNGTRRFTNEAGEAQVPRGALDLALRVRQLGYQFLDRVIPPGVDTASFELTRIAYVLPAVHTTATNVCDVETDSAAALLSAAVLAQLRQGAERYEQFRKAYPFRVRLERRSGNILSHGDVRPTRANLESEHSDRWGERYVPNRIVERGGGIGFSVPILFLSALADPVFWDRHCFSARGVESHGTARVVRLQFAPNRSVRTPDWEGAALVDSASSILRRVEFRLTGLKPGDLPRRLEGYTTFMSPTPYIVVPDTTTAIWWRRNVPHAGPWGHADAVQRISLKAITFLKTTPPEYRGPLP
jgi:hypothetical protein